MALLRLQSHFLLLELQDRARRKMHATDRGPSCTASFSDLMDYAEQAWRWDEDATDAVPLFHTGLGILPILFSTITKCRDPTIRSRALRLMQSRHVQEGLWNSTLTAKVARRVIELEEAQLASSSSQNMPTDDPHISVAASLCQERNQATVTIRLASILEQQLLTW